MRKWGESMESHYRGRLTYAKGTYVEFVVAPHEQVDFGDILVVEGKGEERFYIRAYDFKVKSRWSGLNGVNYLMSKLNADGQVENQDELDFYLGGNHTIKLGMAEQLCYADDKGQLYNPKTCPDFFAEVRSLGNQDTALLAEMKGDLEVGYLKGGRGVLELPVGIYGSKSITEHMGIFGTTGSGKSNLVKVLASSVMNNKQYGLLIFDVHNEYYDALAQHPFAHERLCVYNTQPHTSDVTKLTVNFAEMEPDDVTACATFSEVQLDALYKLAAVWQDHWMDYVLKYETEDIIDELKGCTGQKFQPRTISKIKSICWNLQQELNMKLDESSVMAKLLSDIEAGKIVLVELKNTSSIGEQALATLVSKKLLQHHAKSLEQDMAKLRPVLIVLEEAHRFLGKKEHASNNVFAQLVSEARKFNMGLCVVDQQPRLLADKVLSQLNTLFILGLASRADRSKIETMCRKDILQQRNEIKNLDCGEMIVATNYMRFAAPVKVHKFEDFITRDVSFPMEQLPMLCVQ
ncbi:energy-coupling factor transporter ATP-binding protein EcfA2 [Sporomusaceae bacterium BoRhaA]|nr:energy-coupling factor transporter ATP-binding protein EcfA2 [Pelorhabdus rhamnosifermentans]